MRSRRKAEGDTKRRVASTRPKDLQSPKGRNDKSKGELAEAIFTVKAEALGIALSTPLGDNQAFDFMATTPLGTFRVQVKSAWKLVKNRYIAIFNPRKLDKLNRASGFDTVVVYIAPMDVWYVIPASAIKKRWLKLYPNIPNSQGEYERFREAWRLLTGIPGDDTYRVGLEIHAGRSS